MLLNALFSVQLLQFFLLNYLYTAANQTGKCFLCESGKSLVLVTMKDDKHIFPLVIQDDTPRTPVKWFAYLTVTVQIFNWDS